MQQGFAFIKIIFFTAIAAAVVIGISLVVPVYNQAWKIQDSMETVVHFYKGDGESAAREHLSKLFVIKVLTTDSFPQEFYDNLQVIADSRDPLIELSSEYTVVTWLLGQPKSWDVEEEQSEEDFKGMDLLRYKARLSLTFTPSASSTNL